ncbi:MAG: hypothetical protein LLG45_13120 [Actinomycetia bacterium]|nr:hypothetical protein [Actinomycetes bacterium]
MVESDNVVSFDSGDEEEDPGYVDIMLDLAHRRLDRAADEKRDLDNKAFVMLAANGVLLGLLATAWTNLNPVSGTITLIFIIASFWLTLGVLKTRKYGVWDVEGAWNVFTQYRNDLEVMKKHIYRNMIETDKQWKTNIDEMSELYKRSLISLMIAIILAALSLVLSLFD